MLKKKPKPFRRGQNKITKGFGRTLNSEPSKKISGEAKTSQRKGVGAPWPTDRVCINEITDTKK